MKRLFLSGLVINILVMVINFTTGILSARFLGPEGRGILMIAIRWSGLFAMLFTIGLPGAVIYLGKQFPEKQRELLGIYLLVGLGAGLSALAIGLVLLPHLLANQPDYVIFLAQVSMIGVPFGVLSDGLIGTLQTLNQFQRVMLIRVLNPLGTAVIIVLLFLLQSYTVGYFIIANLAWSLTMFLLPFFWVCRQLPPQFANVWTGARQLLSKGLQIYAGSLVSTFGANLDQLIMSLFLTTYTLGLYAVSSSIGMILPSVIIGAIGIYLFPKLMDMVRDVRQRQVESIHSSLFFGTSALALLGILLLPLVLPFVYGSEYQASVLMGQIMLAAAPLHVAYVVLTNYVSTEGKFHLATISEVIGLTAGIVMMLLLLEPLGGVSAALGVWMAGLAKWGFIAYRCSKLGIRFSSLFRLDWEELMRSMGRISALRMKGKLRKSGQG
jgi:O-antigen/teichoic acid export membrane protein